MRRRRDEEGRRKEKIDQFSSVAFSIKTKREKRKKSNRWLKNVTGPRRVRRAPFVRTNLTFSFSPTKHGRKDGLTNTTTSSTHTHTSANQAAAMSLSLPASFNYNLPVSRVFIIGLAGNSYCAITIYNDTQWKK